MQHTKSLNRLRRASLSVRNLKRASIATAITVTSIPSMPAVSRGPDQTCPSCGNSMWRCWCNTARIVPDVPLSFAPWGVPNLSSEHSTIAELSNDTMLTCEPEAPSDGPDQKCSSCGQSFMRCWCNTARPYDHEAPVDGPDERCSRCGQSFMRCWCNTGRPLDLEAPSDGPDEKCSRCGQSFMRCWCNTARPDGNCGTCNLPLAECCCGSSHCHAAGDVAQLLAMIEQCAGEFGGTTM